MKNTVFVRPNLKAFIFGAVLLIIVQHFMADGHTQGQWLLKPLSANAREMDGNDLRELMRTATEKPSAVIYMRLSQYFENRGDYRQALAFLRQAERTGFSEELD